MSLKVFDLQCGDGHVFEGWFRADQGFEDQAARGLLSCPICGDTGITRKLSAPRLNLGRSDARAAPAQVHDSVPAKGAAAPASGAQLARMQAELFRHMRQVIKNSEDVGPRFAEEALKIHQGDAKERPIRGTASMEERRELAEEGVAVMAVPDFLDDDHLQ